MDHTTELGKVKEYLLAFFHSHQKDELVYHNQEHTESVVTAAARIADHYQLNDQDFFVVNTAAWFHDMGYYIDFTRHEEIGAEEAGKFLVSLGIGKEIIRAVSGCILATRMPQSPANLLEQIVCDADLFHLGTDEFKMRNKLVRSEQEALMNSKVNKTTWREKTIVLLEKHRYFTDYCQLLLNDKKQENLAWLRSKVKEDTGTPIPVNDKPVNDKKQVTPPADLLAQEPKKEKKDRPERGIETMFRVSSANHQRLSDMADNKANLLITVNAIILSAIISLLLRRLEDNYYLAIPTVIILMVSILTMTYAILATRPSIPGGTFSPQDVKDHKVNLLFFGNFYNMGYPEFSAGMQAMMEDKEFLYGSLIRDLYAQGIVLGKKYHLLRVAYNIFMFGLIVAVLAFITASIIHGKD